MRTQPASSNCQCETTPGATDDTKHDPSPRTPSTLIRRLAFEPLGFETAQSRIVVEEVNVMQPITQSTLSTMALTQLNRVNQANKKYAAKQNRRNTDPKRFLSLPETRGLHEERATGFIAKIVNALDPLSRRDQDQLAVIGVGANGQSRCISDQATNPRGRKIFHDAMYAMLSETHADQDVTMYFVTIVDRDWCLPKGAESFDRQSLMHRVMRAMRDIGCHGLMFLEIQAVLNMKDVRYMPHLHGFIWYRSGEKAMRPKAVRAKLEKRFRALSAARAVHLVKIRTDQPAALWQRFFYATKLPAQGKSYCPNSTTGLAFTPNPRGKLLVSAARNYTDLEAARVLRLLAQFQLEETVFAVGEGCTVRKAGSKALDIAAERYGRKFHDRLAPDQVRKLFQRVLRKRKALP